MLMGQCAAERERSGDAAEASTENHNRLSGGYRRLVRLGPARDLRVTGCSTESRRADPYQGQGPPSCMASPKS